jgi:4-hydroxymandelate oxidase
MTPTRFHHRLISPKRRSSVGSNGKSARATPLAPRSRRPKKASASPALAPPLDVADFERAAKRLMSPMAWNYVAGGAADEITLRWNHEAYGQIRLNPRTLVDVSRLDTRVRLLGRELAFPILLAPAAYQKMVHPGGELESVKGAGEAGATMVVSTMANVTLEEIAAAAKSPLWFQLYVQPDRGFTRELVRRAEAAGYQALVVTVDTPVLGPRYRELRDHFTLPPGIDRANLRGLPVATGAHRPSEASIFSATLDPTLTWKDIDWLRSLTRLPVLLKGVQNAADAELAARAGVAGIIVSNHGARNLDTGPATIEALPRVIAKVAGQIPVLVDGGIRRGTDVLKALALGATAVLIGRPYVYGLAVGGAQGVSQVVTVLRRELEMAMASCGRASIAAIDQSVIWR